MCGDLVIALQLLLHLQDFSKKLLAHTNSMQDQVDAAVYEAKVSELLQSD